MSLPIYFINLASRRDRRAFMEDQFARLGLDATRIEAVTPADIADDDLARYCDNTRPVYLRPNQLACSMSHEKAWRTLLEAGHARAVVMEDDALLSASLPAFLAGLEDIEFDLLRFEKSSRKIRVFPPSMHVGPDVALRPFRSKLAGRSGYIISDRAARKMLDHPAMRASAGDVVLYNCLDEPGKGLVRYMTDPALCVQFGNVDLDNRDQGVGQSDLNAVKTENLYAKRHPFGHFIRRTSRTMRTGLRNAVDHLINIPRGITKEPIRFRAD